MHHFGNMGWLPSRSVGQRGDWFRFWPRPSPVARLAKVHADKGHDVRETPRALHRRNHPANRPERSPECSKAVQPVSDCGAACHTWALVACALLRAPSLSGCTSAISHLAPPRIEPACPHACGGEQHAPGPLSFLFNRSCCDPSLRQTHRCVYLLSALGNAIPDFTPVHEHNSWLRNAISTPCVGETHRVLNSFSKGSQISKRPLETVPTARFLTLAARLFCGFELPQPAVSLGRKSFTASAPRRGNGASVTMSAQVPKSSGRV